MTDFIESYTLINKHYYYNYYMKVSILQENLSKSVSIVSRFVASRPQLPILGNILLKGQKGIFGLSAANLENGITFETMAEIENEGSFTVPAKTFLEIVSSMPSGKITLEQKEGVLEITGAGYKMNLNGIPAGEFPSPADSFESPVLSFSFPDFIYLTNRVCFAASIDESRPVLTGVLVEEINGSLTMAATDGYRLSIVRKKTEDEEKQKKTKIILPAKILIESARIAEETGFKEKKEKEKAKEEDIKLSLNKEGNQAVFSFGNVKITTRLIEGEFPPFEKTIPEKYTARTEIDTLGLTRAVKLASVFARDSANVIKFKITAPKEQTGGKQASLEIFSSASQLGQGVLKLEVGHEGEEGEISFNFRFLLDLLSSIQSEVVILETTGPLSPGVFKLPNDPDYLHLIMPVRV